MAESVQDVLDEMEDLGHRGHSLVLTGEEVRRLADRIDAALTSGDFQCRAAQCKRVRAEMQGVIDELRERVGAMEAAQREE